MTHLISVRFLVKCSNQPSQFPIHLCTMYEQVPMSLIVLADLGGLNTRQINNIDFLSEVSTVHQFVYTDEALLLVTQ